MRELKIGDRVKPTPYCLEQYSSFYFEGWEYVVEDWRDGERRVMAKHRDGSLWDNAFLYDRQRSGGADRLIDELFTLITPIHLGGE